MLWLVDEMTVGHSRARTVSHNHIELLPRCSWHYYRLWRHWSGLYLIYYFAICRVCSAIVMHHCVCDLFFLHFYICFRSTKDFCENFRNAESTHRLDGLSDSQPAVQIEKVSNEGRVTYQHLSLILLAYVCMKCEQNVWRQSWFSCFIFI